MGVEGTVWLELLPADTQRVPLWFAEASHLVLGFEWQVSLVREVTCRSIDGWGEPRKLTLPIPCGQWLPI